MEKQMVTAIVLAAGSGSRMKSSVKKQYMLLNGKPLVYYSLEAFNNCKNIDNIIVVTSKEDVEYFRTEIIDKYNIGKVSNIVVGGKERYNSVYNGLMCASDSEYVLIHDGARPLITVENINSIIAKVKECKACVAGMPVKDTIKIVDDENNIAHTPNRQSVWMAQTPQAFAKDIVLMAYNEMMKAEDNTITDDAMVVEKYYGINVNMVECSYNNIKVTTPEDIVIAEIFLEKKHS